MTRGVITLALAVIGVTLGAERAAAAESALVAQADSLRAVWMDVQTTRSPIGELGDVMHSVGDSLAAAGLDSIAGLVLHDAGWARFHSGRLDDARADWDASLAAARRAGARSVESPALNSVAVGRSVAGDLEGGIAIWTELVPLRRALGDLAGEGKAWGNLANAYSLLGRIPEALEATLRATDIDRVTGNVIGLANAHHRRAGLLSLLGRLEEALAQSDSALALSAEHGIERQMDTMLQRRATIHFDLGHTDTALADLYAARQAALERGNRRMWLNTAANLGIMLNDLARPAEALAVVDSIYDEARASGQRKLAVRVGVPKGVALTRLERFDEAETLLQQMVDEYEEMRGEQEDERSQSGMFLHGSDVYAALARCYLERGRVGDAWSVTERGRAAVLRARLGGDGPASLAEVQALLGAARAALVQYTDPTGSEVGVFVVTPEAVEYRELGNVLALAAEARTALRLMASGAGDAQAAAPLDRLAAALIADILPLLPAAAERLYLIPPSHLSGFPFESLFEHLEPEVPRALSYVPSSSVLSKLIDSEVAGDGFLALADPVRRQGTVPDLVASPYRDRLDQPLPESRREVETIAPRGGTLLLGDDASSTNLIAALSTQRAVLHFATHSWIDPNAPARSALLVSGEPELLSAATVESLEVRADLVTLSGCRTIGGYTYLGEGVFGLARSFIVAGSRTVVSSLWAVEDRAARRLMEVFYDHLRAGLARDESLARARRALAAEGFPHRDRSAFILTGVGHLPVQAIAGTETRQRSVIGPLLLYAGAVLLFVIMWRRRRRRPAPAG